LCWLGFVALPLGLNAGQQHTCRFIVGILKDELSLEGLLQNALPQGIGLPQAFIDCPFDAVANREAGFDFGDNVLLFGPSGQTSTSFIRMSLNRLRKMPRARNMKGGTHEKEPA
jgi:hypothetical protein